MSAGSRAGAIFGAILVLGLLSAPVSGSALAAPVIPPGNSAVNQYTESFPTAGGNTKASEAGGRSPARVLGKRNARRLEAQGAEGRAAAALAAATAPETGGGKASSGSHAPSGNAAGGGHAGEPDGSSGLGQVLGQATGTSSGQMGLLLPAVILAALAGSLAYLWRRRRGTA